MHLENVTTKAYARTFCACVNGDMKTASMLDMELLDGSSIVKEFGDYMPKRLTRLLRVALIPPRRH